MRYLDDERRSRHSNELAAAADDVIDEAVADVGRSAVLASIEEVVQEYLFMIWFDELFQQLLIEVIATHFSCFFYSFFLSRS
jgi:hypothetical protein